MSLFFKHRMESEKHFKHKFTHFDTPCSKLDERRCDNAYKLKMNNSEDQIQNVQNSEIKLLPIVIQ